MVRINLPDNLSLPFFAYGIFKPGQLCYPRIKEFVREYKESCVNGNLKERDGIPLLNSGGSSKVKGYLIYFHSGKEDGAYRRIIEIEPDEVYQWNKILINEKIEANVLLGRKNNRGASELDHTEEWDGRSDPFFTSALEEVEDILKNNPNFSWDYRSLFRLQMAYTLLWCNRSSILEKFWPLIFHRTTVLVRAYARLCKW